MMHVRKCLPLLCVLALMVVLMPAIAGSSDGLGRLFTTRAERDHLDKMRRQLKSDTTDTSGEAVPMLKLENAPLVFNGAVIRNGNKSEYWVNGELVTDNKIVRRTAQSSTTVAVKKPDSRRYVTLKPGQKLDNHSGRIIEVYQALPPQSEQLTNAPPPGQ